MYDIARGLSFLHENNLIHNNLRAENISIQVMQNNTIKFKIGDFGMSAIVDDDNLINIPTHINWKTINSMPLWAAPESQLIPPHQTYVGNSNDKQKIGKKSDVWSYGIVLIEILLNGKEPFVDYRDDIKGAHYLHMFIIQSTTAKMDTGNIYLQPLEEYIHTYLDEIFLALVDVQDDEKIILLEISKNMCFYSKYNDRKNSNEILDYLYNQIHNQIHNQIQSQNTKKNLESINLAEESEMKNFFRLEV